MKYIPYKASSGRDNMQIDNDLLDFAINNKIDEPIFRLYAWSPQCISLGRNQSDEFLDKKLLQTLNIDVVRRLTGGRALLHDKELTYSYICKAALIENGDSIISSYKVISQFLIEAFDKLGIVLYFGGKKPSATNQYCMSVSTGADLTYNGKKFIGSAQYRKNGYILQHGSILLDYDRALIEQIFTEKVGKDIISLKEINPKLMISSVIIALETVINFDT